MASREPVAAEFGPRSDEAAGTNTRREWVEIITHFCSDSSSVKTSTTIWDTYVVRGTRY